MGMLCGYECATPVQPLYAMNVLLMPADVRCDPLNLMARMRYECATDIVLWTWCENATGAVILAIIVLSTCCQYAIFTFDYHAINMLCMSYGCAVNVVPACCDRQPSAIFMLSISYQLNIMITNFPHLCALNVLSMRHRWTMKCYQSLSCQHAMFDCHMLRTRYPCAINVPSICYQFVIDVLTQTNYQHATIYSQCVIPARRMLSMCHRCVINALSLSILLIASEYANYIIIECFNSLAIDTHQYPVAPPSYAINMPLLWCSCHAQSAIDVLIMPHLSHNNGLSIWAINELPISY